MKKISFLIAAHNEEKIISKTLDNLLNLPYKNYEVIIGLDGCTDRTEEIVKHFCKKSKKFRYYALNIRKGKPAVINEIIKKAKGEIIIINDADWIFKVKSAESLNKMISVFEDTKMGGIADSFPVEWGKNLNESNFGYKMVAYSSYYWLKYQKEKFSIKKKNLVYITQPAMFLTNIFRRSLYKPNASLGDDFERTYDIISQGKEIVFFDEPSMPRMIAVYKTVSVSKLFKQKIRTAAARKQLKNRFSNVGFSSFFLPSVGYILSSSFRKSISVGFASLSWVFLTSFATLVSFFRKITTTQGWVMRARS